MPRIAIELPSSFDFHTTIPIRITDLNYGGHVGNDTILSLIHEARLQFLKQFGYSETNLAGKGMIMSAVAINFKNELFYGDTVKVSVAVSEVSRVTFDIVYLMEKEAAGKTIVVAQAKTGMACFDYERRKVSAIPEEVLRQWSKRID